MIPQPVPYGTHSQSLERGLAMLQLFSATHPELGIADMADDLNISRPTIHRYAITLVELGYLEQLSSRKYRLGVRAADFGISVLDATGLRGDSRDRLRELRDETGLTASIAVLDNKDILYVDRARSNLHGGSLLGLEHRPGSRLPANVTAMGKVLLAALPPPALETVISAITFSERTPRTIASAPDLAEELAEVRAEGFAVNDEECTPGVVAVAVPVRLVAGEVPAAVGLVAQGSEISLDRLTEEFVPAAASTAEIVAECLQTSRREKPR